MTVLVVEDKLGITEAYRGHWETLLLAAGLTSQGFIRRSLWRSPLSRKPLLIKKGNRKALGFNPDPQIQFAVRNWFIDEINQTKASHVVAMDGAILGCVEPNWNIATIDYLRGGVYHFTSPHLHHRSGVSVLVTVPIMSINTGKKLKEIRAMNDGAESKDEWEEMEDRDEDDLFFEPYSIPYGKFVLQSDLRKLSRLIQKEMGHA